MPSCDPDQKKPIEKQADPTIAQKVEALLWKKGIVSDGSDDKAFIDEAWSE